MHLLGIQALRFLHLEGERNHVVCVADRRYVLFLHKVVSAASTEQTAFCRQEKKKGKKKGNQTKPEEIQMGKESERDAVGSWVPVP